MTEDFTPTDDEIELYNLVSEYLQRPDVAAIPYRQRHLMILIYRKILASSSFAIARTLQSLVDNIQRQIEGLEPESIEELVKDVDGYEEEKEEINKGEDEDNTEEENEKEEIARKKFAESINKNAKGDALLVALDKALKHANEMGWNEKAVVFTESRRTQEYLLRLLSNNKYQDRITVFNGTNDGSIATRAYTIWKKERTRYEGEGILSRDAVIREALIHEFKDHSKILIATEAGAEGINLQFCNIVINYDLPWNPQRAMTFEDRQKSRKDIHKLEKEYSHLADKISMEKKRLFEEKDNEMKKLENKLKIKMLKSCIAKAWWKME